MKTNFLCKFGFHNFYSDHCLRCGIDRSFMITTIDKKVTSKQANFVDYLTPEDKINQIFNTKNG